MSNYYNGSGYCHVDVAEVQDGLLKYAWASRGKLKKFLEQQECPMLEEYMKSNHAWQNRTGTAERGLTADVEESGKSVKDDDYSLRVRLYHTAYNDGYPYGERLEYDYEKRYAILEPTVRLKGSQVVNDMEGVLEKVGFYG